MGLGLSISKNTELPRDQFDILKCSDFVFG